MDTLCRAEVIAVGSEILLGQIHNGHAQTISQIFAEHGFFVFHHSAVGDNQLRIEKALELAAKRSNVVVVTGGLGPTVDDLTKEALAAFLRRPLELSQKALSDLYAYFSDRKKEMPEENIKQAYGIAGGELMDNPNGTAPGQYVFDNGVHYFLLPGPPLEMKPMLENDVIPRLRLIFSHRQVVVSRVLHFCGIGESDVDEQISDLTTSSNPTLAPLAGEGEMLLRITASAEHIGSAESLIFPIESLLRERFGRFIYGVDNDTLPRVVGDVFVRHGHTLAVAESCTGGMVSKMLTDVPGASAWFHGGVIAYANEIKMSVLGVPVHTLETYGAVSEQTAVAMATQVRNICRTTYGLSITGIAGPAGGSTEKPVGLVFIGIATPSETKVVRVQFRGSREQIRIRAAKQALWRLWSNIYVPVKDELK